MPNDNVRLPYVFLCIVFGLHQTTAVVVFSSNCGISLRLLLSAVNVIGNLIENLVSGTVNSVDSCLPDGTPVTIFSTF